MQIDYSWESLFKPGAATQFFNLDNPPLLKTGNNSFSMSNAWWLAEISRLVYRDGFYQDEQVSTGSLEYNCIAFIDDVPTSTQVAVLRINTRDNDSECMVIAFRGTTELDDWNINAHAYQSAFGKCGKVHAGFIKSYTSVRNELLEHINNNTCPFFITGHSLGAALATLAVSEFYTSKYFDSCYTFGSPRAGNSDFINSINTNRIYRVINNCDIVTLLPLDFAMINYRHSGEPQLFKQDGEYINYMNDDEIYAYQKNHLKRLKKYVKEELLTSNIKNVKDNLPSFLSDHALVNYVLAIQQQL